jgi:hypothetical protein
VDFKESETLSLSLRGGLSFNITKFLLQGRYVAGLTEATRDATVKIQ